MKNSMKKILFIALAAGFLFACKDDDDDTISQTTTETPITPVETELITTVQLIFTDSATNSVIDTVEFSDPDGQGGNAPTVETITINANQTYLVSTRFLDESDPNDIEDITLEIEEEDDEHLVCYEPADMMAISIERTDSDGTYEVGLNSKWRAAAASNTTLKLTLKHQPGVKDGSCGKGDTDVEVDFPLNIQ